MLEKWSEQSQALFAFAKITRQRIFRSSRQGRSRPKHIPLQVLIPTYREEVTETDPFAAQLAACREQRWWERNSTYDLSSVSDDSTSYHSFDDSDSYQSSDASSSSTRSISIREIRERMKSEGSVGGSKHTEFDPALKLVRGSWKEFGCWRDMETFLD